MHTLQLIWILAYHLTSNCLYCIACLMEVSFTRTTGKLIMRHYIDVFSSRSSTVSHYCTIFLSEDEHQCRLSKSNILVCPFRETVATCAHSVTTNTQLKFILNFGLVCFFSNPGAVPNIGVF